MKSAFDTTFKNGSQARLPAATSRRWQPTRGGLLNLYLYDYEEFRYERGRLILRGNNGTGKSRVLALQLPFLFDGRCGSSRVEPDADPAKRMEWNLLMDRHQERLGYTWIEFGRVQPPEGGSNGQTPDQGWPSAGNGSRHERPAQDFVTLGCGLSATKGGGLREPWFFITDRRVGHDLFLQSNAGHPLSKSALIEALGERGSVFTTAKEYRQAVDDRLFGLGRQRYDAMVDLLIQLRKPQLSRNLDEKTLARVLGDALPPPSEQMIGDVAESFRGLETDRLELDRFRLARDGVDGFLRTYRRYAQIASRRRAADVRQSQSRFDSASRELKQAERDHAGALTLLERLTGELRAIEIKAEETDARIEALKADPKMRSAEAIQEASTAEQQAQKDLEDSQNDLIAAKERRDTRRASQKTAVAEAEVKLKKAAELLGRSATLAADCALHEQHTSALTELDLQPTKAEEPLSGDPRASRRHVDDACAKRQRAAEQLRAGHQALTDIQRELGQAIVQRDDAQQQVDQAILHQTSAEEQRRNCVDDFLEAYRMWRRDSDELRVPSEEDFAQDLEDWSHQTTTTSPIARILHGAERAARDALKAEQQRIQARRDALVGEECELQSRLSQLESGFQEPPLVPPFTNEALRTARPGAPFWSLVDFAEDCPIEDRAALEAALESAGILNAWVTPDGSVLAADFQDVMFSTDATNLPAENLGRLFKPEPSTNDRVPRKVVAAILERIGFGEQDCTTWLTAQGHWRNGQLRGHARKTHSQHVGHEAREEQRLRSLAAVRATLSNIDEQQHQLLAQLQAVDDRLLAVARQLAAAPVDNDLRAASTALEFAAQHVLECRKTLTEKEHSVAERRKQTDAAREKLELDARDLGLAEWALRPDVLLQNLAAYRQLMAELWPLIDHCQSLKNQCAAATAALREAEEVFHLSEERQHDKRLRHSKAEERLKTLRETLGAEAADMQRELAAAEQAKLTLQTQLKQARTDETQANKDSARTEERITSRQESVNAATELRQQHCAAFQRLCGLGILQIALEEPVEEGADQWSLSRTLEISRHADASFSQVSYDDAAWDRVQQTVTTTIQDLNAALSQQAFTSTLSTTDDLFCVTVPYQGHDRSVQELRNLLSEEVEERQRILDEHEREIIENHLIGEVAAKLHEQIHEAHALVEKMNAEILKRPMSTGMTLKFAWKADEDQSSGMMQMCQKLLAATGTWSPSERAAIGRYLQEHIKQVRDTREAGTWQEHLAEALDYRRWHRFWVLKKQDSGWQKLTKRTHGTGSGGEKAVALTIPQFAAAAAHYSSARLDAPRLILLDEAFVGIDPDMRGKCMELINVFDLDFLLTSENEWGCYPGLPGVAIHQLSTRSGYEAVFLTRWIWNGKQRYRDDFPLPPAAHQDQ